MSKNGVTFFPVLVSLILANPVWGHVELVSPVGGETFYSGDKVNIRWQITIPHEQENWDVYFSSDGGVNWDIIESDLDPAETSYQWTVPQLETDQARIRIYMDNVGTDYDDTSDDFTIRETQASVHLPGEYPKTLVLYSNYPNPFNPVTTFRYDLPVTSDVTLTIYDILGRNVRTLVQGIEEPGYKSEMWDGTDNLGEQVSAGVYLLRIEAGDFTQTRKMVLLR